MVGRWRVWALSTLCVVLVAAGWSALARRQPPQSVAAAELRRDRELAPAPSPPPATPSPAPSPAPSPTARPLAWQLWRDVGYVPILMYHYIREADATADPVGFRLSVRPDRFAEQIDWLAAEGYHPLRMSDLAACLRGLIACPPRPVAITFDDGYDNAATVALPILMRHGFPATFYIITGNVGRAGYLSWEQVRALRDGGMEIGAHTITHPALSALPLQQAQAEIVGSKQELERRLGIAITSFSYPTGDYDEAVAELVRAAGFTNAVTTRQEDAPRRLDELPRRRVIGGESIKGFRWYFVPASLQR